MLVLGIDPGTAIVGYALVQKNRNILEPVCYGCITTKPTSKDGDRLCTIENELKKIIEKFKPDAAAVEKIFFFKNVKTVIGVSQARGVIMNALARLNIETFEYTPLQVKISVSGYGKAPKQQVQKMVKTLLCLKEIPKPDDAADALAIAICHLNQRQWGMENGKIKM